MNRVVVIGAGLGGLATSIRLAHAGYTVTILEKNDKVGGKVDFWQSSGYTFDTGPSLLTMPFVLEDLFRAAGKKTEDYLDLVPVDPICRYDWPDGSRMDASTDIDRTEREMSRISHQDAAHLRPFLAHGKRIFDAAYEPFLASPFGSLRFRDIIGNLRHLLALPRIDAFRSLNQAVEEYFSDTRIRQLFNRFATYSGSSPYRAPATLSLIPYIEFMMGGWYLRGGMYELAAALERIARELGVEIRTDVTVEAIEGHGRRIIGVGTHTGELLPADTVVCNADALYAERELLGNTSSMKDIEPSLAGFVLLLGANRTWPMLAHHNVFFSDDYLAEFDMMFNEQMPAANPTIYVCNTSATDPQHAPSGCSNLFVLVNAPPLPADDRRGRSFDWDVEKTIYRNQIVGLLETRGLNGLGDSIEVERIISPDDFAKHYNAYRGSIYGMSSNSRASTYLRSPNRSRRYGNLYFAGGSAHPGGGIPLVLLSGNIVSDMILRDQGKAGRQPHA
jgi:diapolycopene oxygenase